MKSKVLLTAVLAVLVCGTAGAATAPSQAVLRASFAKGFLKTYTAKHRNYPLLQFTR